MVGTLNEAEIMEQLRLICPGNCSGDISIETEIIYYEED